MTTAMTTTSHLHVSISATLRYWWHHFQYKQTTNYKHY